MSEIFAFDRKPGETIDELLTRFDLVRTTAAAEGGIGVNHQTLTWFL